MQSHAEFVDNLPTVDSFRPDKYMLLPL